LQQSYFSLLLSSQTQRLLREVVFSLGGFQQEGVQSSLYIGSPFLEVSQLLFRIRSKMCLDLVEWLGQKICKKSYQKIVTSKTVAQKRIFRRSIGVC